MTDHTKGPWMGRLGRHGLIRGITDTDGGRNIVNWNGIASPTTSESQANARLIAAAPDMYEALKALLMDTQHSEHNCGDEDCPVTQARAALAKAEGK